MIHEIRANHDSFRPVRFTSGLNMVVAERAQDSSTKDTRNGLGKTTLIEIIHFCLGANKSSGKGLALPALAKWAFTMELSLGDKRISVTRKLEVHNAISVSVLEGHWPELPPADLMGERVLDLKQWRALLGRALFLLRTPETPKYNPSFRSLISYFVRLGHDAYGDPFTHVHKQSTWDIQLHIALLLGLEWRHAVKRQLIREKNQDLKNLRKLAKRGIVPSVGGSIGEMETERITLSQEIEQSREALNSFKVHPQYESIQEEANRLTEELHAITNANVIAVRHLQRYRDAIKSEEGPSGESVLQVYTEMGVVFAGNVLRSIEKATSFYEKVVRDRRRFLSKEIERLEHSIEDAKKQIRELTEARAERLQILHEHGALEEMNRLQERHVERCEALERLKEQIENTRQMESAERELAREKAELAEAAACDYVERTEVWDIPVRQFNLNSKALYQTPGHLVIDTTDSGFKFRIEINKSGSDGIGKMKIFCFDLALLEFSHGRGLPIGFLVHDSEMYDGVDSRQRAAALERAHAVAARTGTQYICALNSDMIPYEDFSEGFNIEEFVRCRLTDGDASGTLLGIVFDPPTGS